MATTKVKWCENCGKHYYLWEGGCINPKCR